MQHVFTIDLEDWFQGLTSTNPKVDRWPDYEDRVVESTVHLLDILCAYQVKATFFVLGYVADRYPYLIEQLQYEGHEIGVHGYFHRFVNRMTPDEFRRELDLSMHAIEGITGTRPIGHRAPYFSINGSTPWAFECLAEQGIRYDSSVFPTRNMLYGFPGAPRFPYMIREADIAEFPASTCRVAGLNLPIAGGFYQRLLPYSVTQWAIRQLEQVNQPAILYIHPWELDTGQKYRKVTLRERITHYYGRAGLEAKLGRLLSDFRFQTMGSLYASWRTAAAPRQVSAASAPVGLRPSSTMR